MRLLLDTHSFLWTLGMPERLQPDTRDILVSEDSIVYVSMASLWECAIKTTIGKLMLPEGFFEALPPLGFELLNIEPQHLATYTRLSLHHRDPFDRILVAQAKHEQLMLVTHDKELLQYDVNTIPA